MYKASTPGPVKDEKLTPRITETAKALWFTYLALTVMAVIGLRVAGMSWFDAICHGFSAIALGGFSTRDASIGAFDSPVIELVLIVIMLVAACNFSRHFLAFRSLSLRPYASDTEAKAVMITLGSSIMLFTILLWANGVYPEFGTALRHGAFNVISIGTTAGFVTANYELWPAFMPVWLIFLSCITCSTGSTGGGIKMFRTLLLVRHARRELKLLVHPSAVIPIRIAGHAIPDRIAYSVLAFIFLYFITIVVLTFAMLATDLDLVSSFSAVVASVNNMGPALNKVGPAGNFSVLSDVQTWICSVAMLVGRLEIFAVVVLFTAHFWRK
jgi:trk system potassium uptake protein TrkH